MLHLVCVLVSVVIFTMSEILQLVRVGRELGLQEEVLAKFVATEQNHLTDERQAER